MCEKLYERYDANYCTCNILSWYYFSRLPILHLYYIVLYYSVSILTTEDSAPLRSRAIRRLVSYPLEGCWDLINFVGGNPTKWSTYRVHNSGLLVRLVRGSCLPDAIQPGQRQNLVAAWVMQWEKHAARAATTWLQQTKYKIIQTNKIAIQQTYTLQYTLPQDAARLSLSLQYIPRAFSQSLMSHVLNPCVHVKQGAPCKGVA